MLIDKKTMFDPYFASVSVGHVQSCPVLSSYQGRAETSQTSAKVPLCQICCVFLILVGILACVKLLGELRALV